MVPNSPLVIDEDDPMEDQELGEQNADEEAEEEGEEEDDLDAE